MDKKKKKIIIIIGAVVAAILIAGLLFLFFRQKEKTYRLLKVYEAEGKGEVERESIGKLEPYVNMNLESGDTVRLDIGTLNLKADEDKFIYLEDHTELKLFAAGDEQNSRTRIELISGGVTNDIRNKLSNESSFEVNTPNSTMSVRGTVFFVSVYEENGIKYTKVSVFNGSVATKLVYEDGTESPNEVMVNSGKEVLIYNDDKTTDYVSEPKDIEYPDLSEKVLKLLGVIIDEQGVDLSITKEEIDKLLEGPFTVTFTYQGSEFGRQTVKKDGFVEAPKLAPAPSGSWKYDFSKPVDRDLVIEWEE